MKKDILLATRFIIVRILFPMYVLALILGLLGECFSSKPPVPGRPDTLRTDSTYTSHYESSYTFQRISIPTVPRLIVWQDTLHVHDTILIREQRVYSDDSTYTAWVSGYDPRLDSISVLTRVVEIRDTIHTTHESTIRIPYQQKASPIRFGITAGPTITPHGLDWGITGGITLQF